MSKESIDRKLEYFKAVSEGLRARLECLSGSDRFEAVHISGRLYAYAEMICLFEKMLEE